MRDARRFSTREVSHGVQRHILAQTTWLGSTLVANSGAAPLVLDRLTVGFRPAADYERSRPTLAIEEGIDLEGISL